MPRRKKVDPKDTSIEAYRAKRSADATTEPFGEVGADRPRLFVIHKHHATRLHYDLRLEWGGVLRSWAVPQTPSLDPAIKRLAVRVEDHPVEYADFEGVIPKGEYGAGPVIVWDRGAWTNLEENPEEAYENGKVGFELHGYKLRGKWALVRIKDSERDWLLIKKPDEYAAKEGTYPLGHESILSGLSLQELREGNTRADEIAAELKTLKAKKGSIPYGKVQVMQAETADAPFTDDDWVFEIKYDGFRLVAQRHDGEDPRLFYRSQIESTHVFPDVVRALQALPFDELTLDGEVVVFDANGRPNFHSLQQRTQLQRKQEIERAMVEYPATFVVFDVLTFGGHDLRPLPLLERKRLLRQILPQAGPLKYSDHIEGQGEAMFEEIQRMGLEGIMGKAADSPYSGIRSARWQKIKVDHTGDFVIVGFRAPKGQRTGFGAVHLAAFDGENLVYVGRAGSGFSEQQLVELHESLSQMKIKKPPCKEPIGGAEIPRGPDNTWVEPTMVCEVRYRQLTDDGVLRMPVFLRMRHDKSPKETELPMRHGDQADLIAPPVPKPEPATKDVKLTNLKKTFWPEEGYTKGDLIDYYRDVSEHLLPYLQDRPVVMTRYPDGIDGKSFYQKDAPGFAPGWVRTARVWAESSEREIDYFVADDIETLTYMVNLGTIPLHIWLSREKTLQQPDWCLLDLDPKGAPFKDVVKVARAIKKLCDEIELPTFVKTTGSTGLHILIPLGGLFNYKQSRTLGNLIGNLICEDHPDIATMQRVIQAREGKVYIDFLQNRHGQLMVSPYSVRPLPGAPVSAPLKWNEVNGKLDIKKFTIKSLPKRIKRMKEDPVLASLSTKPDLLGALARLEKLIGERN